MVCQLKSGYRTNEEVKVMLKRFKFKNSYSFKDETSLSLEAVYAMKDHVDFVRDVGKNGNHEYLLPVAAIYGANAGGKSNLIQALLDCAQNICRRTANPDLEGFFAERPLKNRIFYLTRDPVETFEHELTLILDDYEYIYRYEAAEKYVSYECLERRMVGTDGESEKVLMRDTENGEFFFKTDDAQQKAIIESISQKYNGSLIANLAGGIGIEPFLAIYKWCESVLFITRISSEGERNDSLTRFAEWLKEDIEREERLNEFIKKFDQSIKFANVKELTNPLVQDSVDEGSESNQRARRYRLMLTHGYEGGGSTFPIQWESAGTRKLLELYLPLYNALEYGRPLIYDELDVMLHPLIFQRIITMFNDPEENKHAAQLIFAAHNTMVMKREHLRRDEIHIIDKDENGKSTICRLSEYEDNQGNKIRKDARFDKLYLEGLLGGIPDNFFQARA